MGSCESDTMPSAAITIGWESSVDSSGSTTSSAATSSDSGPMSSAASASDSVPMASAATYQHPSAAGLYSNETK